jgi:hypothetical protein
VARVRRRTTNQARLAAATELDLLRLRLTNVAGRYGGVLESQIWNGYLLAENFFETPSSPTDWFRNATAAWLQGIRAGTDFYRGALSAICRSEGPSGPQSSFDGKTITFYVDEFSEACDPVTSNIPGELIDNITIGNGLIGRDNVSLTLTDDEKLVQVALCNLEGLVPGQQYHATLSWNGSQTPLVVNVLDTPPT